MTSYRLKPGSGRATALGDWRKAACEVENFFLAGGTILDLSSQYTNDYELETR